MPIVDNIQIDTELQSLIPPLTDDEFALLEQSILKDGCREPIFIWASGDVDYIVDGHNRYAICQKHNLPLETRKLPLTSKENVKAWMALNQLGRRNLHTYLRAKLAKHLEPTIRAKAQQKLKTSTGGSNPQPLSNLTKAGTPINTRKELASIVGISDGAMYQATYVTDNAPEYIQRAAEANTISTNRAYEVTKRMEQLPDEVVACAAKYEITHPDKLDILKRLHSNGDAGTNTFAEIRDSGYIQPGEEEEAVNFAEASIKDIEAAIRLKYKHHKGIASSIDTVPHVIRNTGNNEWYTPPEYIEAARRVMGSIDTDPASSLMANSIVKAEVFYTASNNGLTQQWRGNIWMNPPYSSDLVGAFIAKFVKYMEESKYKNTQGIVLVNNATETKWGQMLLAGAGCVCFPSKRIKYLNQNKQAEHSPLQGQMIIYYGSQWLEFCEEFKQFGVCINAAF